VNVCEYCILLFNRHYNLKLSQLSNVSFERDTIGCTDAFDPETSNTGRAYSSIQPHITMDTTPPITHTPNIQDTIDNKAHAGFSKLEPSKMTDLSKSSQPVQCPNQSPVQSKLSPPPAKAACLRCRGKKSRCSGQRPCRGCSNSGLECLWEGPELESQLEPKRTRNSGSAQGADTSRRSTKGKGAPVQVRSACTRCQHRKAKCSGTRPACTYCTERSLDCTYSVAEGATRVNDLKRTDEEATTVLAKLRIGESLQGILCSLPVSASSPNGEFQSELNRRLSAA
jgi:hypothetical protein